MTSIARSVLHPLQRLSFQSFQYWQALYAEQGQVSGWAATKQQSYPETKSIFSQSSSLSQSASTSPTAESR